VTYVGKPPPVMAFRPADPSTEAVTRRRAGRLEIARAYDEAEALELEYYEAEEKWLHALRTYERAARDPHASVVALRTARHDVRLRNRALLHAHVRFLDARARLRTLLGRGADR